MILKVMKIHENEQFTWFYQKCFFQLNSDFYLTGPRLHDHQLYWPPITINKEVGVPSVWKKPNCRRFTNTSKLESAKSSAT